MEQMNMDSTETGNGGSRHASSSGGGNRPAAAHTQPLPGQSTAATAQPKRLQTVLNIPEHMDLCQIQLIYRAEGNANLVLALPEFKKVLRLPKTKVQRTMPQQQLRQPNATQQDQLQQQQHSCMQMQYKQQKQQEQKQLSADSQNNKNQEQVDKWQTTSALTDYQNAIAAGDLTMNDFMAYIQLIRQLLGVEHIFDVEVVAITEAKDRDWINAHIRPFRPAHRLEKEFCGQFGLLLTDATQLLPASSHSEIVNFQRALSGHEYAIEIKPKQGWLLPSDVNDLFDLQHCEMTTATTAATNEATATSVAAAAISRTAGAVGEEDALTRSTDCTRCRYCAMQYLKLRDGKINKRSAYCPLDLFSGVRTRMLAALNALFLCPQNNLRVFCNGNLIYDDHSDSLTLEETIFKSKSQPLIQELLVNCLLRDYGQTAGCNVDEAHVSVKAVVAGQPHSSATLKQAHTNEREQFIEKPKLKENPMKMNEKRKANTAAGTATENEAAFGAAINEPEMRCLPKNCILQKLLQLQLLAKRNMRYMLENGYANRNNKSYDILKQLLHDKTQWHWNKLNSEQQYQLGATALDCSIMITFCEVDPAAGLPTDCNLVHVPEHGRAFLTKVTLLDLDPKPDSHFSKYVKQTKQINACLRELP